MTTISRSDKSRGLRFCRHERQSAFERLQASFFGSSVVVYCKIGRWAQNMNCWNLQKLVQRTSEDIKDNSQSTCDIATDSCASWSVLFWGWAYQWLASPCTVQRAQLLRGRGKGRVTLTFIWRMRVGSHALKRQKDGAQTAASYSQWMTGWPFYKTILFVSSHIQTNKMWFWNNYCT